MQRNLKIEPFFDDGDQHVHGDGNPNLRFHGVLACAIEALDSQVLLDPLEEQLDLPALPIQRGDGERGQLEVVGQKDQRLGAFGVAQADAAQVQRVMLGGVNAVERDGLIADQTGCAIDGSRIESARIEPHFGARDKEGAGLVQAVQAAKVEIRSIHDVESARLGKQQVEHVDVVELSVGNVYKARDGATQVEQRVQLHRRLRASKWRPGEHRQTQTDGE